MQALANDSEQIPEIFSSSCYRLVCQIGEGGFGKIYKAIQLSTNQTVAIKFLSVDKALDADKKRRYIERFHREADLVSRLNHPNIVRLLDKGQQGDELLYAVYEYIEGQTLKAWLHEHGPMKPTMAAKVMATVLDALAHAHEKGVLHRDIKPANIMLFNAATGIQVKVLDFGIGTLMHEARQLDYKTITLTQETLGTPSYSAPEQLRGEPPVAQTDIYVWGLVFLECLTAKPTITGSSLAAIFHQQLSPGNVPLGVLAGHESAHLLRRVLNKKPQQRPQNTAELYHGFEKLNFSNLVGPLFLSNEQMQKDARDDQAADMTQIAEQEIVNEGRYSFTRLTERKQVSVLCLVLTTLPLLDGDVENQDVIDTFHADQMQQCIDIAVRYGGYHVGTLGDTVLFYFGYPNASDNDSRLCARTALDIAGNINKRRAYLEQSQGFTSRFKMGMQTGLMLSLAGNQPEGKAAHDAMSLCRKAACGQIWCSENVKQLLQSHLNFEPIAQTSNDENDIVFQLNSERKAEAFGFLRGTRKNRAFIGREQELDYSSNLLGSRHEHQRLHIFGEAGIGKSRLIFELREHISHKRHFVAQCLPEHQNNALHPILNLVSYKYSLDALSPVQSVGRLQAALQRTSLNQEQAEHGLLLLSAWLALPLPEHNPAADLTPETQKRCLFEALAHLLSQSSAKACETELLHLYIFEDLHWADPTSVEFVRYFVTSKVFEQRNSCWVNTSRLALPELLADAGFNLLEINKLSNTSTTGFVESLFDQQPLSDRLSQILVERSDGIPLFIEELVGSLQANHMVAKVDGKIDFIDAEHQALVPLTLRDSLQQKLDRLRQGKDTAQLAATIGREFDYQVLAGASDKSQEQLQLDLNELVATELIYLQRQVGADSYIFKHALVSDAAYDSMSKEAMREAHRSIACSLEQQQGNVGILARHFGAAKMFDKAVEYGTKAANNAAKISAPLETIAEALKVEKYTEYLASEQQVDARLSIYSLLTSAYMEAKGWASEEVYHYTDLSNRLLRDNNRFDELIPHLWWKVLNGVVGAKNEGLLEICRELESYVDNDKVSHIAKAAIKCAHGFVVFAQGGANCFPTCLTLLESAVEYYQCHQRDRNAEENHETAYGFNVGVFSKVSLARVLVFLEQADKAHALAAEALKDAEVIKHVPSIGIALMYCAEVALLDEDTQARQRRKNVLLYATRLVELAQKHNMQVYQWYGEMEVDWAKATLLNEVKTCESLQNSGSYFGLSHYQSYYAQTYADNHQPAEAIEKIDFCLTLGERSGHHFYQARKLLYKARFMRQSGNYQLEDIVDILAQAEAVAHAQGASCFITQVTTFKESLFGSKST